MSLKKNILILTWFNFFTDFKLYAPIAIIYFASITHSYALAAIIFSISSLSLAFFDIPTGIFADRIGRKRTVILGAIAAVLYSIFYAIGISFWFLVLGAFFEGLSRALYSGNNSAFLHNMLSEEGMEHEYHVYSGKLGTMFQVALAVSGILGSLIASWSFPLIMWLSVIPQLICLFISFQLSEGRKGEASDLTLLADLKNGIQEFGKNINLRLLSVTSIIEFGVGESSYQFLAAFYNSVLPLWAVGAVKSLSNIGAAFGFYFSGKVIDQFGIRKILFFGTAFSKFLNFLAYIIASAISPFLIALTSFFFGTSMTAQATLLQQEFTDKQRATMSSINSFAGSIFFSLCVFSLGFIADSSNPRTSLLILQIVSLPSILLLWKLLKLSQKN